MYLHLSDISRFRYMHTMAWALLVSSLVVAIAATIGRATLNLQGALMAEDAGLAVMMLLPEEEISEITMLRANADRQEFLAETKDGPMLIRVKRGTEGWFVQEKIPLRETGE